MRRGNSARPSPPKKHAQVDIGAGHVPHSRPASPPFCCPPNHPVKRLPDHSRLNHVKPGAAAATAMSLGQPQEQFPSSLLEVAIRGVSPGLRRELPCGEEGSGAFCVCVWGGEGASAWASLPGPLPLSGEEDHFFSRIREGQACQVTTHNAAWVKRSHQPSQVAQFSHLKAPTAPPPWMGRPRTTHTHATTALGPPQPRSAAGQLARGLRDARWLEDGASLKAAPTSTASAEQSPKRHSAPWTGAGDNPGRHETRGPRREDQPQAPGKGGSPFGLCRVIFCHLLLLDFWKRAQHTPHCSQQRRQVQPPLPPSLHLQPCPWLSARIASFSLRLSGKANALCTCSEALYDCYFQ